MLSVDTNILFHALNSSCPQHKSALAFIQKIATQKDVAISEFILAELYVLVRNPALLVHPMHEVDAASLIETYRTHPYWKLIGFPSESQAIHNELWKKAGEKPFARHRIFDAPVCPDSASLWCYRICHL
jgi:predicted nucleic acid-binding protein